MVDNPVDYGEVAKEGDDLASVAILILFGATGFTMAAGKREDETQAGS